MTDKIKVGGKMYKIIITDANNNILLKEFHNRMPDQDLLDRTFYRAVKTLKTFIFITVETVKYSEL